MNRLVKVILATVSAVILLASCGSHTDGTPRVYGNPFTRPNTTQAQCDKDFMRCADYADLKVMPTSDTYKGVMRDQYINECMFKKGYCIPGKNCDKKTMDTVHPGTEP